MKIILSLLLLFICACWAKKSPEAYFEEVYELYQKEIPKEVRLDCRIGIRAIPEVVEMPEDDFRRFVEFTNLDSETHGLYLPFSQIVYLPKDSPKASYQHEFIHHIQKDLSRDCLDEIGAYFGQALLEKGN